jgi:hypothetical protein
LFQNPSSRLSCKALILKRASQPKWSFHNHMIMEKAATSIPVVPEIKSPKNGMVSRIAGRRKGSVNFGNRALDEKDSPFRWTPCRAYVK